MSSGHMVVRTYLRGGVMQPDGSIKTETWLSCGRDCDMGDGWGSREGMIKGLSERWKNTHRIELIENGIRLYPIPPSGSGEHYQDCIWKDEHDAE